jgi:hypothetical protein
MIKFLKWLVWLYEGDPKRYYRYKWDTFKNVIRYQWWPNWKRRMGMMELKTVPNFVRFVESLHGLSYRVESAKELADLKEDKKQEAKVRNAEEFEMTFTKRTYGYNKNWFHRGDPGTAIANFIKGRPRS